jgi:hypothetical protein
MDIGDQTALIASNCARREELAQRLAAAVPPEPKSDMIAERRKPANLLS